MSRIRSFRELLAAGENECRALVEVLVYLSRGRRPEVIRIRRVSLPRYTGGDIDAMRSTASVSDSQTGRSRGGLKPDCLLDGC